PGPGGRGAAARAQAALNGLPRRRPPAADAGDGSGFDLRRGFALGAAAFSEPATSAKGIASTGSPAPGR
ncbi:hypothetical protein, partial [Lysobacter antibioticus]|uniref:hypothetical protein n=1 Tax=Lysobacter antibioticus TaxID=84531 RepID=UPI001C96B9CC